MTNNTADTGAADSLSEVMDGVHMRTQNLELGANGFARAMTQAFAGSIAGGKQFDDVLKSLVLRFSDMSLKMALRPLTSGIASGIQDLFASIFGATPFAAGGVVGTPTYFPMQGGLGVAGEAGPEAILPLARGSDGRLGVAAGKASGGNVTVHISTPDAESFRRSEAYITGQIARAVARGQRSF